MMFDLCLLFSSHVCILSKALFHWNAESLLLHEYKANSATHEHVGEDILKHAHACSRCAETSALSVPPTPLTLHVFLLLGVFLVRKGPKKKLFLFFFSSPSSLDAGCVSVEHPSFVTSGRVSFKKNFLFIAGRVSFEKLFCLLPDVSRWKHDCPDPCWEPAPSRQRVSENRSAVDWPDSTSMSFARAGKKKGDSWGEVRIFPSWVQLPEKIQMRRLLVGSISLSKRQRKGRDKSVFKELTWNPGGGREAESN